MKISLNNVRNLGDVDVTVPDKGIAELNGKNGSGKSNIIQAIAAAFCGGNYDAKNMIKNGEDKGYTEIDYNGLTIRVDYSISKSGKEARKLTVLKDGVPQSSGQSLLKELGASVLEMTPTNLASMSSPLAGAAVEKQLFELIKSFASFTVDPETLSNNIKAAEVARTTANKIYKEAKDKADALNKPEFKGLPDEPDKDLAENYAKQLREINAEKNKLDKINFEIRQKKSRAEEIPQLIKTLEAELKEIKASIFGLESEAEEISIPDDEELTKNYNQAVERNNLIEAKKRWRECDVEAGKKLLIQRQKIDELEKARADLSKCLADANVPAGFAFDFEENTIYYSGKMQPEPTRFKDMSQGQKITALVDLLTSKDQPVKILLLPDAQTIDGENYKTILDIANNRGWLLFTERLEATGIASATLCVEDGNIELEEK